ncbi:hypothetical protein HOG48_04190 [Candidatus Peregrinibacteria bacterium]|jgi:hypothetical protein|nr:hypothetical protein [Candidatus Peregrinibacteria bacterium]
MGKLGFLSKLRPRWAKAVTGVFVLALGMFSLNSLYIQDARNLQSSLLTAESLASEQSVLTVYDATRNMFGNQVHSGEMKILFALEFKSGLPDEATLTDIDFTFSNTAGDVSSLFTNGEVTSDLFLDGAKSSYSNLVVIKDQNSNDEVDPSDIIVPSSSPITYTVASGEATATWASPGMGPLETGDIYFIAANINEFAPNEEDLTVGLTDMDLNFANTFTPVEASFFVDAYEPEVVRVIPSSASLTSGATVAFTFNQSMNVPSGTSADGLFYAFGDSQHTWGAGASVATSSVVNSNDTVTITLGSSPTVANGDEIMVNFPSAATDMYPFEPIALDTDSPDVLMVYLHTDKDGDGKAESRGDEIAIFFDKRMRQDSFDYGTLSNSIGVSSGSISSNYIYWPSDDMMVIRLTANNGGNDVVGANMNFQTSIKAANNRPLSISPVEILDVSPVPMAGNIMKSGTDSTDSFVNSEDLVFTWEYSPDDTGDVRGIDAYLLKSNLAATPSAQPLNYAGSLTLTGEQSSSGQVTFDASQYVASLSQEIQMDINWDSESTISQGGNEFNFIDSYDSYRFHVNTCDDANQDNPNRTCIMTSSSPFSFSDGFDADMIFDFVDGIFIESAYPGFGTVVGPNVQKMAVRFSAPLDQTTLSSSNITLRETDTPSNTIAVTADYISRAETVVVTPGSSLSSETEYELVFGTGVKDDLGRALDREMVVGFKTNTNNITSAPTIVYSPQNGTPPYEDFVFQFNRGMNPSTLTSSNISISPDLAGAWEYDSGSQSLIFRATEAPDASTSYTFTLNASAADIYGNALAVASRTPSFTTGTADSSTPEIRWARLEENRLEFGLSMNPIESSVTSNNFTVACNQGGNIPIDNDNIEVHYDMVEVRNVQLTAGDTCRVTLGSNMEFRNGQAPSTTPLEEDVMTTFGGHGSDQFFQDGFQGDDHTVSEEDWNFGEFGMFDSDNYENRADDKGSMFYTPIFVDPIIKLTGAETKYMIGMPITQEISHGDKIRIKNWPAGTVLSSASIATDQTNDDINGPDGGELDDTTYPSAIVTISNVTFKPSIGLDLTLSVDVDGDSSGDSGALIGPTYLDFVLDGITNGSTASNVDFTATSSEGNRVDIEIRDDTGRLVEEVGKSEPIWLMEGGSGEIDFTIKNESNTNITSQSKCEVFNWQYWQRDDCDATFNNLPNGTYEVMVEAPDGFFEFFKQERVEITNSESSHTVTRTFKRGTNTVSGTVSGAPSGTLIDVIASGPDGMVKNQITMGGGATAYSLEVNDGFYFFNLAPGFNKDAMFHDNAMESTFAPPRGQDRNITENTTINWAVDAPDQTIQGKVVDANGNPLSNVFVDAFVREETKDFDDGYFGFGGVHTTTNSDGTFSLNVMDDQSYNVMIHAFGQEKEKKASLTGGVQNPSAAEFIIKIPKADYTASGKCLVDNSPVQCFVEFRGDEGNRAWADDRGDGDGWTAFVSEGSWTGDAHSFEHGYIGQVSFDVIDEDITDQNFSLSAASFGTISGKITVDGAPAEGFNVFVEEYNTSTQIPTGNMQFTLTDSSGTASSGEFDMKIRKNSANTRLRLFYDHSDYGAFPSISNIDISSVDWDNDSISPGDLNTVTATVTGMDSLGVSFGFINLYDPVNNSFAGRPIDSGDGTYTVKLPSGTYYVDAFIDRLGNFLPSELDNEGQVVINDDTALTFDLSASTFGEVTVTVQDSDENLIPNAHVEIFGNGRHSYEETDSSGEAVISVATGTGYNLRAFAEGYTAGSASNVAITEAGSTKTLIVKSADSQITGTVEVSTVAVGNSFIFANCNDGSRIEEFSESDGTFSIPVPTGTTCTVSANTPTGYQGAENGLSAGDTGITVDADTSIPYAQPFDSQTSAMDLSTGGTVKVVDDNAAFESFQMDIPTGALATSSANGNVSVSSAAPPESSTAQTLAAVNVTATNLSTDTAVTSSSKDMDLIMTFEKSDIDEFIDGGYMEIDDLTEMQNAYYDADSGSSATLPTTRNCQYQEEAEDSFVTDSCDDLVEAIQGSASFNDYKVTLSSTVDHFTVFTTVISKSSSSSSMGRQRGVGGYVESLLARDDDEGEDDFWAAVDGGEEVDDSEFSEFEEEILEEIESGALLEVNEEEGTITHLVPPFKTFEVNLEDIENSLYYDAIYNLASRGILKGYSDGNFYPDKFVSRAELVKIAASAMELPVPLDVTRSELGFSDVMGTDWFAPYLMAAKEVGLIDAKIRFRPHDEVNRAEALKILLLAAGANLEDVPKGFVLPFADVERDAWYRPHVKYAYFFGIIRGVMEDGLRYFRGGESANRGEVADIVVESFDFDTEEILEESLGN